MNISEVSANLSGKDILSIINEYVNIENLTIDNIVIEDNIKISGSYKKLVKVGFLAEANVIMAQSNNLYLKLESAKISKVPVFKGILNTVLKHIVKDFEKYGVFIDKSELIINFNTLENYIPYVNFTLDKLSFSNSLAIAYVKNIVISKDKDKTNTALIVHESKACIINKKEDKYKDIRIKIKNKVPEKYKPFMEYFLIIPDIAALLARLFKDKRVSIKAKAIAGGCALYLVSPIDIIPDFIPFIGQIDDLSVAFFAINTLISMVPENVILENWSGNDDIIKKVKEGTALLNNFLGKGNVKQSLSFIKKRIKKHKEEKHEKGHNIH